MSRNQNARTAAAVLVRPEDLRRGWFVALAIVLMAMGGLVALSLVRSGTAAPHVQAHFNA